MTRDQLIRLADSVRPSGYWDREDIARFGWIVHRAGYRAGVQDGAKHEREQCALAVEQAGIDGLGTLAAAALIRQQEV